MVSAVLPMNSRFSPDRETAPSTTSPAPVSRTTRSSSSAVMPRLEMTSARWNAGACGDLVQHVAPPESCAPDRDQGDGSTASGLPRRRRSDHGHRHVGMEHMQRALQLAREIPACFEDAPIERRRLVVRMERIDRRDHRRPAPRLRALHDQHGAGAMANQLPVRVPEQQSPTRFAWLSGSDDEPRRSTRWRGG